MTSDKKLIPRIPVIIYIRIIILLNIWIYVIITINIRKIISMHNIIISKSNTKE